MPLMAVYSSTHEQKLPRIAIIDVRVYIMVNTLDITKAVICSFCFITSQNKLTIYLR